MRGMDGADIVLQHYPAAVRKMRVAMVTETYPPEINGVAMTMGRIVSGLQARGHTVQLIRPRQHPGDRPLVQPLFEEVLQRGMPIPRYDALKLGLPAKQALMRLWAKHRPDIVHVVTEGPLGWSALGAASRLKLPVTTDFHTNFHSYSAHYGVGWLKTPITAYLRKFHNKALSTLVPTESLRRELEVLGFRNLEVVARGVDTALFNPQRRSTAMRQDWGVKDGEPVALSVGRLAPEKNLPLVLRAYQLMRELQPRLRLVLVGDGPERTRLARENPEVIFAGMRTGEDLAAHYASADVFLFPSMTETYGNVTVEAMASGLAVVAYDYAAAQQHIRHHQNGVLVPFGAADDYVQAAAALVNDTVRIRAFGKNARAVTEKLDWSCIVAEFEQALLRLTDDAQAQLIETHAVA
jgi:glycosyltransferase involved in cell wall biosynthesis